MMTNQPISTFAGKAHGRTDTLSRDVVACLKKLAPSPAGFWRATGLQDSLSQSTFLRAVGHLPVSKLAVRAITEAYELLLASRLYLSHDELEGLAEVEHPEPREWASSVRALLAEVDSAPGGELSASVLDGLRALIKREDLVAKVEELGLRSGPSGRPVSGRKED